MDTAIIESGVLSKYSTGIDTIKHLYKMWRDGFTYECPHDQDTLDNFLEMLTSAKGNDIEWWARLFQEDIHKANSYKKAVAIHKENGTYNQYMDSIKKENGDLIRRINQKLTNLLGL